MSDCNNYLCEVILHCQGVKKIGLDTFVRRGKLELGILMKSLGK